VSYDACMSRADRERWESRHAAEPGREEPAEFLVAHADLLRPGRALDIAAGTGRNARYLAARGFSVVAVELARSALMRLRAADRRIACVQMDLDRPGIRAGSADTVVIVDFLDRRLFDAVAGWLRPGGVLVWDTFLIDQRTIGHPRNPDFLLARGELAARLAGTCDVLALREGLVRDRSGRAYRAGVVARRRPAPA
jgi:tellurite methyltransferase